MITLEEIIEKTNHIPSSVYEAEQSLWLRYLSTLPGNPNIVDFGTGWGKSALSLALACPQGFVYTFDTGVIYIAYEAVKNLEEYHSKIEDYTKEAKNLKSIVASSLTIPLPEFEIDVLNIDSAHDYETTKAEIERWLPRVKQGGLVFLHDWEHPKAPGVKQAWDELVRYNLKDLISSFWDKNNEMNEPATKLYEMIFLDKAVCPTVTTAVFKKL
jgi:predicted O-methyltransferase YrrM